MEGALRIERHADGHLLDAPGSDARGSGKGDHALAAEQGEKHGGRVELLMGAVVRRTLLDLGKFAGHGSRSSPAHYDGVSPDGRERSHNPRPAYAARVLRAGRHSGWLY